jgi:glutamate 5-kinase
MKKVVVKIGSSVIAPGGELDSGLVSRIIKDVLAVEKKGYKVVLVSSGAIACGLNSLGYKRKPQDMSSLMAISSLGQIILMDVFNEKFKKYKRKCAQLLLTWDDFDNRKRFVNINRTIDKLLNMSIIPVINENDAVSHEEIRFGDNDRLSALVANLIGACELIMLSDIEGLFEGKVLVKEVSKIDSVILGLAKREDKTHTSGGMLTKLQAAGIAISSGIRTTIAYGHQTKVILRIVEDEKVGTRFIPSQAKEKARKRWIAFSKKAKGKIFIDKGAADAVLCKGKSLLAVGIVKSEGAFKSGDAVYIVDEAGLLIGYGIVNYDSASLKMTKNKKFEKEVIHRDNFVKVFHKDWTCDL